MKAQAIRYRPVPASVVPRGLRWDTPERHKGHTCETAFGGDPSVQTPHDAGATWMRTTDLGLADHPRDYFRLIEDPEVELDAPGGPVVVFTRNHSAAEVDRAAPDGWRVRWDKQQVMGRALGVYTAELVRAPVDGWVAMVDAEGRIGDARVEPHTCRLVAVLLSPNATSVRVVAWVAERSIVVEAGAIEDTIAHRVPAFVAGEFFYEIGGPTDSAMVRNANRGKL